VKVFSSLELQLLIAGPVPLLIAVAVGSVSNVLLIAPFGLAVKAVADFSAIGSLENDSGPASLPV
jgi:hypothetical protein